MMRSLLISIIISLVLFFIVYPAAFIAPSTSLPDTNDTRLIAYIISQQQNNIIKHQPLYFANFFAPYDETLTFSEPFLTSALLTLPARLLTKNPIIIFNIALIIGFNLTFIASYYLFRLIFNNTFTAFLGSLVFNLSGFHLAYLPHLQMFSLWPFLMALYFFLRRSFFLFLVFVTLQMAESFFPVYLIFFSVVILLSFLPLTKGEARKGFSSLLLFLPIWLYLTFPYLKLPSIFPEAIRPIRDAAHFSLGLEEIFTKYHPWTLIILFVLSFLPLTKGEARKGFTKPWNHILFFSLLMSLGPVLKVAGHTVKIFGLPIPLPYSLFYYFFPGFKGFRTPSRFIILASLAATIIIMIKISPLFNKLKSQTKYLILATLLLLLMLEAGLLARDFEL